MSELFKHTFPLLSCIECETPTDRPEESTSALIRSCNRWLVCNSTMSEVWHSYLSIFVHHQFPPCLFIVLERFQIQNVEFLPLLDTIVELGTSEIILQLLTRASRSYPPIQYGRRAMFSSALSGSIVRLIALISLDLEDENSTYMFGL
jgi:hypothetical protein